MFPSIVKEKKTLWAGEKTKAFGSVPRLQEKVQLSVGITRFGIQSCSGRARRLRSKAQAG